MELKRTSLVSQCQECVRSGDDGYCTIYQSPQALWRAGKVCPGFRLPVKNIEYVGNNYHHRIKNRSKRR